MCSGFIPLFLTKIKIIQAKSKQALRVGQSAAGETNAFQLETVSFTVDVFSGGTSPETAQGKIGGYNTVTWNVRREWILFQSLPDGPRGLAVEVSGNFRVGADPPGWNLQYCLVDAYREAGKQGA